MIFEVIEEVNSNKRFNEVSGWWTPDWIAKDGDNTNLHVTKATTLERNTIVYTKDIWNRFFVQLGNSTSWHIRKSGVIKTAQAVGSEGLHFIAKTPSGNRFLIIQGKSTFIEIFEDEDWTDEVIDTIVDELLIYGATPTDLSYKREPRQVVKYVEEQGTHVNHEAKWHPNLAKYEIADIEDALAEAETKYEECIAERDNLRAQLKVAKTYKEKKAIGVALRDPVFWIPIWDARAERAFKVLDKAYDKWMKETREMYGSVNGIKSKVGS